MFWIVVWYVMVDVDFGGWIEVQVQVGIVVVVGQFVVYVGFQVIGVEVVEQCFVGEVCLCFFQVGECFVMFQGVFGWSDLVDEVEVFGGMDYQVVGEGQYW